MRALGHEDRTGANVTTVGLALDSHGELLPKMGPKTLPYRLISPIYAEYQHL